MTTVGTFTALPSLAMVEAADHAYQQVLTQAQARGADALGPQLAMNAALAAAQVASPAMTVDQVGEIATLVTAATDPRVALIDALRGARVEVVTEALGVTA